ncbi:MAG: nuclear transport factor 2 family protein [Nocardioides sp.]|jgi:ketosteroid isomerase-like protein
MSTLTRDEIERLERERWIALMGADLTTLASLYADDLVYTHSNGVRDTKESFLELLRSGTLRYVGLEPSATTINIHGELAVVTGDVAIEALTRAGTYESTVGYTAVWARIGDDVMHVAWHSSPKAG